MTFCKTKKTFKNPYCNQPLCLTCFNTMKTSVQIQNGRTKNIFLKGSQLFFENIKCSMLLFQKYFDQRLFEKYFNLFSNPHQKLQGKLKIIWKSFIHLELFFCCSYKNIITIFCFIYRLLFFPFFTNTIAQTKDPLFEIRYVNKNDCLKKVLIVIFS